MSVLDKLEMLKKVVSALEKVISVVDKVITYIIDVAVKG